MMEKPFVKIPPTNPFVKEIVFVTANVGMGAHRMKSGHALPRRGYVGTIQIIVLLMHLIHVMENVGPDAQVGVGVVLPKAVCAIIKKIFYLHGNIIENNFLFYEYRHGSSFNFFT